MNGDGEPPIDHGQQLVFRVLDDRDDPVRDHVIEFVGVALRLLASSGSEPVGCRGDTRHGIDVGRGRSPASRSLQSSMRSAVSDPLDSRSLAAFVAAFSVYLVVDFLIHAVFLTRWWQATADSWHPPETLFAMIPYAYVSFAGSVVALMWLMERLLGPTPGPARSLSFGAAAGGLFGSLAILGTYSVLPVPASALAVWPITFGIEAAGAATTVGLVRSAARPWLRTGQVFLAVLATFAMGVVIQNLWIPTSRA